MISARSKVRLGVALVAGAVFYLSGGSIYRRPDFETSYEHEKSFRSCFEGQCIHYHTMTIGNTGRKAQDDLVLSVRNKLNATFALPVRVRNNGKAGRQVERITGKGTDQLHLGVMNPGQVVEVSWALQLPATAEDLEWKEVVSEISPAVGPLIEVSPRGISFLRLWARILS